MKLLTSMFWAAVFLMLSAALFVVVIWQPLPIVILIVFGMITMGIYTAKDGD